MKKIHIIILAIILFSLAISIYLYPQMPSRMASHWNTQNEVDGFMSKFWGLFLMPIVSVGVFLLFLLIPKIDPLKKNIAKFREYYEGFILLIIIFLLYIHLLSIAWNLDFRFSIIQMLAPALGILFFYSGILMENAKRNWFIGVRTPWTLSSDAVWNKTNKLGGKLFKISGLVALLGMLFPGQAVWLTVGPVIIFSIYIIFYSYFKYQKQGK